MAGGLAALLDDIAALTRLAAASADDIAAASAKAGSKAMGVVIDDAAVAPQYVKGLKPQRELPIIWRITKGSLVNKLVIIFPILLLLSAFAPFLLTPLLMLGGLYLSYEGAHKIGELVRGTPKQAPAAAKGAEAEDRIVSSAVRTDLILSAEIMVISLNSVEVDSFWMRAAVLLVIAVAITVLVYGAVAILVKMDDVGLAMAEDADASTPKQRLGRGIVAAMPRVMDVISYVGMVAMLWVGGHILLVGTHDLGLAQPYGFVHHLEGLVAGTAGVGGLLAWLLNTFFSFVLGLVVGGVIAAILHVLPVGGHDGDDQDRSRHADGSDGADGSDDADGSDGTDGSGRTGRSDGSDDADGTPTTRTTPSDG